MPRKCSVSKCRTNYDACRSKKWGSGKSKRGKGSSEPDVQPATPRITVFKFPSDPVERQKWIDALPNTNLHIKDVTDWMGVCANHWYADAPLIKKCRMPVPTIPPNRWPTSDDTLDPTETKQSLSYVLQQHEDLYCRRKVVNTNSNSKNKGFEAPHEEIEDETEHKQNDLDLEFLTKDLFENSEQEFGKPFKDCFVERICFHGVVGLVSGSEYTIHSRPRIGMVHSFAIYFKFQEIVGECTVKSVLFEGYFGNQLTPYHKFTNGIIRRWSELAEVVRFYTLDYKLEDAASSDNNAFPMDTEPGMSQSHSGGGVMTLESSVLDDRRVTQLVGEYLHLCQTIQSLKDLARINMDLLYLTMEAESYPAVREELDKVRRLVQSIVNGREALTLRVVDREDHEFDFDMSGQTEKQQKASHRSSIGSRRPKKSAVSKAKKSAVKKASSPGKTEQAEKNDNSNNNNNSHNGNDDDCELTEIDSTALQLAVDNVLPPMDQSSVSLDLEQDGSTREPLKLEEEKEKTSGVRKPPRKHAKKRDPSKPKKKKKNADGDGKGILDHHSLASSVKTNRMKSLSFPDLPPLNIVKFAKQMPPPQPTPLNIIKKARLNIMKDWFCDICGKKFKRKSYLDKHMELHGDGAYPCSVCKKEFKTEKYLKIHQRIHGPGPRRRRRDTELLAEPLLCSFCGRKYHVKASYLEHIREHKEYQKNGPLKCGQCGKQFHFRRYLRRHMARHRALEMPCTCEVCGKTFRLKSTLTAHKYRIHGNKAFASPTLCPICGKLVSSKIYLQSHINSHNGVKPFQCSICQNKFTTKASMQAHQVVHTGNYPYRCTLCNRENGFMTRFALRKHIKLHEVYPFCCDKCGKLYKSPNSKKAKFHAAKCNAPLTLRLPTVAPVPAPTNYPTTTAALADQEYKYSDSWSFQAQSLGLPPPLPSHPPLPPPFASGQHHHLPVLDNSDSQPYNLTI